MEVSIDRYRCIKIKNTAIFLNPLIFFGISVDIVYTGSISPPTHASGCLMGIGADMRSAYRLLFYWNERSKDRVIYKMRHSGYYNRTDAYDTKHDYRFD